MHRYTNLALGGLLAIALVTGVTAQAIGTGWGAPVVVLHGVAGLGLVLLTPWKSVIARRGFRRPRSGRIRSTSFALLVVVTIATGLTHSLGSVSRTGPLTVMQVHIGAGLLTAALAVEHYRRHPLRPRRTDLSRRTFLRTAIGGMGAAGLWLGWESTLRVTGARGAARRHTGSHERGSDDPAAMPVTQWLDDRVPDIDATEWRLSVDDRSLGLADLEAISATELTATLDCTGGWYATQQWRGPRLDDLVDASEARSILVRSATGYARRFPASAAGHLWLALEVGGAPLSAGHGSPARLVAPGRRGFWWVKWVDRIETSQRPWWFQLPFPVT